MELEELSDNDEIAIGRFRLYFVSLSGEEARRPASVGSGVG